MIPTATYSGSLVIGVDSLTDGDMIVWYGGLTAVSSTPGTVLYLSGSVEMVKSVSGSVAAVCELRGSI